MANDDFINALNERQREAVEYAAGPMLVIAGAGSGKTRMLTCRIAWLIRQGVNPGNILALTFTNKAANEMKERIANLVGSDNARHISMGTFHSRFLRILREEYAAAGFKKNFSVYDESSSQSLIKTIIREMKLDDKTYKPSAVHARISRAKNNMLGAAEYAADRELIERDRQARTPAIAQIFLAYEQRLRAANAIDFDGLLLETYRLFRDNDAIRRKWEEQFQHILVDEYQDTNRVQQAVLTQLTRARQNICVVGDDAQSIYAFRGANIDNILSFTTVYPAAKLFKLERNYRSTQRIVNAANSLIHHNKGQIAKDVFSNNEEGEKLRLIKTYSDTDEANTVAIEIEKIRRADRCDYAAFAVLYRTNAQSRSFEDAFRRRAIPYRIYAGMSFYQRKEIMDIIAYFRLVANPDDEEAFKRIINYPARGIGEVTLARISAAARKSNASLWQVCSAPEAYSLDVNEGTRNKLLAFASLINDFRSRLDKDNAFVLGQYIIKNSGIIADISALDEAERITRQENIDEFGNALSDFVADCEEEGRPDEATLEQFMQEVALQTDREGDGPDDEPRVALMTVHAAKGLEFPTVFVVGLDENIFPSSRAMLSSREMEEERRLLYVAITRAARHCILTCAKTRWRYGKTEYFAPSRFLKDIDARLVSGEEGEEKGEGKGEERGARLFERPFERLQNSRPVATQFRADPKFKLVRRPAAVEAYSGDLREGQKIDHERFGRGVITALEGSGDSAKATVEFEHAGRKQLMLKFAKFTVVE
ncbi:MAG: UvrD-helicase domain-containing protein [Prevotella sp.]|nr:UvrD-helicase domain-containing protein [Prevotella sp.]